MWLKDTYILLLVWFLKSNLKIPHFVMFHEKKNDWIM